VNIIHEISAKTDVCRLTSTTTLLVHVSDVNDEPPHFSESTYLLSVSENLPSGAKVGRVAAFDADLPPNDRHTYQLDVTPQLRRLFRIDASTGIIYTRRALDRELAANYQLTAVVTGSLRTQPAHTLYSLHPAGFPANATQRTQRKERNEMTSLLDRPITTASDDGVCRWHAAKLWQTHAVKYEITEIKFYLHHELHNK